ncbi:MAG: hypothetical protein GXO02_02365, partial [Epsilonproteobacteria bacterium]|nr:hypothetical protein [Campylobacterota bacterium]
MRKIFLIFIPILLFGNFKELIRSIDHSKRLKAIYYKSLSAKYEYLSQKGDRYPKIDLNIRALFLK